jgi:hypothetical protein
MQIARQDKISYAFVNKNLLLTLPDACYNMISVIYKAQDENIMKDQF